MEGNQPTGGFVLPPDLRMRAPARKYMGLWVGFATVVVAAGALFCEMHLTAVPLEQTLMTAAVMILCCFIMYTSMFDVGHQRAVKSPPYEAQHKAYTAARERVRERGDLDALEGFCNRYISEELTVARKRLLLASGVPYEVFVRWQEGEMSKEEFQALNGKKRRGMKHAAALTPLKLTSCMLMHEGIGERRQVLPNVGVLRARRTLTALLPTIVGSLITVSVTIEGMLMTPAAIVAGILRLFTVIWTGVRGYSAGAYAVMEDDATSLEVKTTLLLSFLQGAT